MTADRIALNLPFDTTALFLSDGHTSRYAPVALEALAKNHIRLYLLPSHTSHATQPLDLVTFGSLKTASPKILKTLLKKCRPEDISETAFNRCCAMKACLEGLHQSTSIEKIRAAFARSGLIITAGSQTLIIDPQKSAAHLPNPDHIFDFAIEPPRRSAVYSCVLNETKFIKAIKVAKDPKSSDEVIKSAWEEVARLKDSITKKELDVFNLNPNDLPWKNCHLIGKDPNVAFQEGSKKRVSIAPKDEKHWSAVLLDEKKKEIAARRGKYTFSLLTDD